MRTEESSRIMSSPCSSNEPQSNNGSPETKLTAFSPEDVRARGHPDTISGVLAHDGGPRKICTMPVTDPFLIPPAGCDRLPLSATAKAFTPGIPNSPFRSISGQQQGYSHHGIGHTAAGSRPDHYGLSSESFLRSLERNPPSFGPIGTGNYLAREPVAPLPKMERLDADRRCRAFVLENVPRNIPYMTMAGFFNRREFTTVRGPMLGELSSTGKVYVAFTDCRDCTKAVEKLRMVHPEWRITLLTAREYVYHTDKDRLSRTSDFEGQLSVAAYYDSRMPVMNHYSVGRCVESLAMTFGDLKQFSALPTAQHNMSEFRLEYSDIRDSENAMATLNGAFVDNCFLEVKPFRPDLEQRSPVNQSPTKSPVKDESNLDFDASLSLGRPRSSSRTGRRPYMELSITGRSAVPAGEHANLIDWMSGTGDRMLPSPSPQRDACRFPDPRANRINFVDVERIQIGLDVRTTIMLRNIPNKIDQAMLKTIMDETSFGKYDFMYLRIDFANNCNVGYAFINFVDPLDIIPFVQARAGRPWNCFNSDKIAEVSYATIQGKDCLVQKFRNSSVMLEHPSFRPKIFHTGTGPLAGTEDRFPGPDNVSKMRRSIENAEHVGLFAPRLVSHYRDERRGLERPQIDRAIAAMEQDPGHIRTCIPRGRPPMDCAEPLRSAPCTYPTTRVWLDSPVVERGPKTS